MSEIVRSVGRDQAVRFVRMARERGSLNRLQAAVLEAVIQSDNMREHGAWRGRVSVAEIVTATGYSTRSVQRALNGDTGPKPLVALSDRVGGKPTLNLLHRDGSGTDYLGANEVPLIAVQIERLRALAYGHLPVPVAITQRRRSSIQGSAGE